MTKQEAKDWLNNIIEMDNILGELAESKKSEGVSMLHVFTGIHIRNGIEILANALGAQLSYNNDWRVNEVEHTGIKYFLYGNIEVFQLYDVAEVPFS